MARHAHRPTLLSHFPVRQRWAVAGTATLIGLALLVAGVTPEQAESPIGIGHIQWE